MRRILLAGVTMLVSIAGLTLGFSGVAGAAGHIVCTALSERVEHHHDQRLQRR